MSDLDRARARVELLRDYATEVIAGAGYHPQYRAGIDRSGALELAALAEAGLALREALVRQDDYFEHYRCRKEAVDAYDAALPPEP